MQSTYEIIWTKRALTDLSEIVSYLEENWTDREIENFFGILEKLISRLRLFPNAYPVVDKIHLFRKALLSHQTSIVYRVLDKEIEILTLSDNRAEKFSFIF